MRYLDILSSVVVLACAAPGCSNTERRPQSPAGLATACEQRRIDDTAHIVGRSRQNVVRVFSDTGSGSGFILAGEGDADDWLLVTNYHVIANGSSFSAEIIAGNGRKTIIGELEVVKVDPGRDLALLRTGALGKAHGLALAPVDPAQGESILALGFPVVGDLGQEELVMTAEPGTITSVGRVLADGGRRRRYHQTNATIHPGNSGGPVLNACAQVEGVVVAKIEDMEGVNLLIPGRDVAALTAAYRQPRQAVKAEVTRQMQSFFDSLGYEQSVESTAHFSRGFLRERVMPLFELQMSRMSEKMDRLREAIVEHTGEEPDDDVLISLLLEDLDDAERLTLLVAVQVKLGKLDTYAGLRQFMGHYLPELFGSVHSAAVDRVKSDDEHQAQAFVRMHTSEGIRRWVFDLEYEWGDWRISGIDEIGD